MWKESCRSNQSLNSGIKASLWLLFGIACFLTSILRRPFPSFDSSANDQRAAIISVVEESDVLFVVSSVQEVQPRLDLRYEYDWILVSSNPLSENFKTLSSAVTGPNIKHDTFSIGDDKLGLIDNPASLMNGTKPCYRSAEAMVAVLNLAQFTNGRRYASYLTLEPRTGLICTLSRNPLPAFKAGKLIPRLLASATHMYASGQETLKWVSFVKSLMAYSTMSTKYLAQKAQEVASHIAHGLEQLFINFEIDKDVAARSTLQAMCPKRLLDHIDTTTGHFRIGNAYLGVPTISQSIGQPRKSVWSRLRKRDFRYVTRPSAAEPTVESNTNVRRNLMPVVKQDVHSKVPSNDRVLTMTDQFDFWEFVAMDFDRQDSIPSLRSGNTVIDERNFAMM